MMISLASAGVSMLGRSWGGDVTPAVGPWRGRAVHGPHAAGRREGQGNTHPEADALVHVQRPCGRVGQACHATARAARRRGDDPCRRGRPRVAARRGVWVQKSLNQGSEGLQKGLFDGSMGPAKACQGRREPGPTLAGVAGEHRTPKPSRDHVTPNGGVREHISLKSGRRRQTYDHAQRYLFLHICLGSLHLSYRIYIAHG
jgi:hypothetical protein